jgi:hypothetical protein
MAFVSIRMLVSATVVRRRHSIDFDRKNADVVAELPGAVRLFAYKVLLSSNHRCTLQDAKEDTSRCS